MSATPPRLSQRLWPAGRCARTRRGCGVRVVAVSPELHVNLAGAVVQRVHRLRGRVDHVHDLGHKRHLSVGEGAKGGREGRTRARREGDTASAPGPDRARGCRGARGGRAADGAALACRRSRRRPSPGGAVRPARNVAKLRAPHGHRVVQLARGHRLAERLDGDGDDSVHLPFVAAAALALALGRVVATATGRTERRAGERGAQGGTARGRAGGARGAHVCTKPPPPKAPPPP